MTRLRRLTANVNARRRHVWTRVLLATGRALHLGAARVEARAERIAPWEAWLSYADKDNPKGRLDAHEQRLLSEIFHGILVNATPQELDQIAEVFAQAVRRHDDLAWEYRSYDMAEEMRQEAICQYATEMLARVLEDTRIRREVKAQVAAGDHSDTIPF